MKRATAHLKNKNIGESGNGNGFKDEEIKAMLEEKAGKSDFAMLNQLKTNKSDTELMMKWLELMQKQLKQLSVIQTEVAGALVQRP